MAAPGLRALLLAPPGAGKGTQGERIAEAYGVAHLATGDLLRAELAAGSEIGLAARQHMEAGDLVPDDVVLALVAERIAGPEPLDGYVLDGFPRMLEQAEAAYRWGRERDQTFHAVVHLEVPTDELVRRLLERGRRDGRSDDDADTIVERLRVYSVKTAPLLEFYAGRGILVPVDGTGSVDDVFGRVVAGMAAIGAPAPPGQVVGGIGNTTMPSPPGALRASEE